MEHASRVSPHNGASQERDAHEREVEERKALREGETLYEAGANDVTTSLPATAAQAAQGNHSVRTGHSTQQDVMQRQTSQSPTKPHNGATAPEPKNGSHEGTRVASVAAPGAQRAHTIAPQTEPLSAGESTPRGVNSANRAITLHHTPLQDAPGQGIPIKEVPLENAVLRVLIVEPAAAEAARILHALSQAGVVAVAERIDRAAALYESLGADQWDAVFFNPLTPGFELATVLSTLRQHAREHSTGLQAKRASAAHSLDSHNPTRETEAINAGEAARWAEVALPLIVIVPRAEGNKAAAQEAIPRAALQAVRDGAADYFVRDDLARLAASLHREIARQRRAAATPPQGLELTPPLEDRDWEMEAEVSGTEMERAGLEEESVVQEDEVQVDSDGDFPSVKTDSNDSSVTELPDTSELVSPPSSAVETTLHPTPGEGVNPDPQPLAPVTTVALLCASLPSGLLATAASVIDTEDLPATARHLADLLAPLLPFDALELTLREGNEWYAASAPKENDEKKSTAESRTVAKSDPLPSSFRLHPSSFSSPALSLGDYWHNTPSLAQPSSVLDAPLHRPLRFGDGADAGTEQGDSIGSLHLVAERSNAFDEGHAALLQLVSEAVALGVQTRRERARANAAQRTAQQEVGALVRELDAILWEADATTLAYHHIEGRAEALLGYPAPLWLHDPDFWPRRIHPEDRAHALDTRRQTARDGQERTSEYRVLTRTGETVWLREVVSRRLPKDEGGRMKVESRTAAENSPLLSSFTPHPSSFLLRGLLLNISDEAQAHDNVLQSHTILQATQEASAAGICLLDDSGGVVSYNRRFGEMWRLPVEELERLQQKGQLLAFMLSCLNDEQEFLDTLNDLLDHPFMSTRDEIELRDGRVFERYSALALSPKGTSYGRVWSFLDITDRHQQQEHLAHQAAHDVLTELPNRAPFFARVQRALANRPNLAPDQSVTLLFMDLDRFKVVNDSLGHDQGDAMLREIAQRLPRCVRPDDMVARFGGDEFTLLLERARPGDAEQVCERIAEYLDAPILIARHELHSSASIGIVHATPEDLRPEDLLRKADVAMYEAKRRGGGRYQTFDVAMNSVSLDRLQLEIDLRQAVRRDQLRVHYQPIVASKTGRITGVEALLRWERPGHGLLPPLDFVGIAEETGLIVPIGAWVLREACAQTVHWAAEGAPSLEVSVNLSARQFRDGCLCDEVSQVLQDTGLPPSHLKLEITETAAMEDVDATVHQLNQLKKLGVKLAIDDFGTGYSALSYLERFSLDTLKIDRSFVTRIGGRGENTAIVRAVSTLGQALGVEVTAEGVETAEQLLQVRAIGCDTGQGFFFARPLEAHALGELLRENPQW